MKFDCQELAPSGRRMLKLRMSADEIEIMRALVKGALRYTPETLATMQLLGRLRAMAKCLNSPSVNECIMRGDIHATNQIKHTKV